MDEIDLELGGTRLVDHGVDIELGLFAEIIDMLDDVLELAKRFEPIGLAGALRPACSARKRLERKIGIENHGNEVEFNLGRDHLLPPELQIQRQYALKDNTRRELDRIEIGRA